MFSFVLGFGLTSDMWTETYQKKFYISLTVHFFEEGRIKFHILKSDEYDGEDKTGAELLLWFERALDELFGPYLNYFLVTDSGPNYVAGFKKKETRFSCIAHSLHLAVLYLFGKMSTDKGVGADFNKVVSSCQHLATHLNHVKPKELKKTVKNVVVTRWNSHLIMMRSILEQWETIRSILEKRKELRYINFSKNLLSLFVNFLTPLEDATMVLSQSEKPTIHLVVPILNKIMLICEPDSKDAKALAYLKSNLKDAFEEKIFEKLHRVHFAATLLDFRFKDSNFDFNICPYNTESGRQFLKDLMTERIDNEMEDVQQNIVNDPLLPAGNDRRNEPNEFESYFSSRNLIYKDCYEGQNLDILKCWGKYKCQFPKVYRFATWILAVPATSVLSEKNFSDCKWMINSRRSNLKPENVNNSLVVKSSFKY